MHHLILALEAPLMAFGGETVDNYGVVRSFPAASMLTGLLANALGWRRTEAERHQRLQERLIFGARIDREPAGGVGLTDFQTAAISKKDSGWTTRGAAEGREGGNYTNWLRYRDYLADMRVTIALRMSRPLPDPGWMIWRSGWSGRSAPCSSAVNPVCLRCRCSMVFRRARRSWRRC